MRKTEISNIAQILEMNKNREGNPMIILKILFLKNLFLNYLIYLFLFFQKFIYSIIFSWKSFGSPAVPLNSHLVGRGTIEIS